MYDNYNYGCFTYSPIKMIMPTADIERIYQLCDAALVCRDDVHESFSNAVNEKTWARFYLTHQVREIVQQNNIVITEADVFAIADKISKVWFNCSDSA